MGMEAAALCVTGSRAPLPTITKEVYGVAEESIPEELDMWEDALVSKNHSEELGGVVATPADVRAEYRVMLSQAGAPGCCCVGVGR